MKKVLLTIGEYTKQGEVKKKKVTVGRIIQHEGGGESIALDSALCATIAAMGQKALNAGEDSVWLSMWEEQPQQPKIDVNNGVIQPHQIAPQPQQAQQAPVFTPPPQEFI